jgi:hypothetical protein
MVEHWVQPLKLWVTLLYDYSGVEDLTCETMEMLEVYEVMKQVRGLVSSRTIVTAGCTVKAFLVTFSLI